LELCAVDARIGPTVTVDKTVLLLDELMDMGKGIGYIAEESEVMNDPVIRSKLNAVVRRR